MTSVVSHTEHPAFRARVAPDPTLFHEGHDPHDRKMGQVVTHDLAAYDEARVVLVGCPQDIGVCRNRGRPGAAGAPREIRRQLYRLAAPRTAWGGTVFDAGDVRIEPTLEQTHADQRELVSTLLRDGKSVIVLGGGNDISYADVAALADVCPGPVLAFNIDSHFDVREAAEANSGTPYRQLLEEGLLEPGNLYEMGNTPGANSPVYARYLERKGVPVMSLDEIRRGGVERVFREVLRERHAEAVFWGFDMDAVRASDAPGVSAGYPVGFTAAEICRVAREAGREPRTRLLEITECNPAFDIDHRTSRLAAMMIVCYLESLEGPPTGE